LKVPPPAHSLHPRFQLERTRVSLGPLGKDTANKEALVQSVSLTWHSGVLTHLGNGDVFQGRWVGWGMSWRVVSLGDVYRNVAERRTFASCRLLRASKDPEPTNNSWGIASTMKGISSITQRVLNSLGPATNLRESSGTLEVRKVGMWTHRTRGLTFSRAQCRLNSVSCSLELNRSFWPNGFQGCRSLPSRTVLDTPAG
jgi:hypothetical protein